MLFINRTIVYGPIKYTLFYIVYKRERILLVELRFLI